MNIKEIEIKNLLINTENPRFEPVQDQQSAIDTMLTDKRSNLKNLAKDIAEKGLNPGELLYVTKENKKYIVLEGNRRVTAIKLITDPQLVRNNAKNKKFFQDLNNKPVNKSLLKLNCVVFNNKKDAEHWIKLRHTGENNGVGTVTWDTESQERYRSDIGANSKLLPILDFMKRNNISRNKVTIIEKLLTTPYVRKKIGIDLEDGKFILDRSINQDIIVGHLRKVTKAINNSDFSPDKIYQVKDKKDWIDKILGDQTPQKTSKAEKKRNNEKTKKQTSINNKDRKKLIPSDFILNITQERINLIYEELKSLEIKKYNNAVAVLFRVFLELSVDHFIDENKAKKKLKSEKNMRPPTLKDKLEDIVKYMEEEKILTKHELKPIRTSISDKDSLFSIDTFNSYVHNRDHNPITEYLEKTWSNYSKFIPKLWE